MSNFDELLHRNASFAQTGAKDRGPAIPFIPNRQVYILTCIDPRVDPAQLFGLELGDAIVARTVGGRVTPAVLQDLAWISYLHETKTPDADWFEFAVMHHTDCGSGFFADDDMRHGFAARGGYDDAELAGLAVLDPAADRPGRRGPGARRAPGVAPDHGHRPVLRRQDRTGDDGGAAADPVSWPATP